MTTRDFCEALCAAARTDLPADVRRVAERSLFNVLGTSISAARSPAVDIAVRVGVTLSGAATSPVPGRPEKLDAYHAALATGIGAHLDDFDDTHLQTVIHPAASTMATMLALGTWRGVTGSQALRAFALGCEAQLRVGNAISPWHYDAGWHITGTCGVIGTAVAASVLLNLDAQGFENAIGIAACAALGQREAFGTMTKPLHAGGAAANGILAASLAENGFTAPNDVFETVGGFFAVMTPQSDPRRLDGVGRDWELLENTFKPYPCGIVAHPGIDAALELAPQIDDVARIRRITLVCNPLVPELMGRRDPADGLGARFSAVHGVAVALIDKRVGLQQFSDARVTAKDVARLRALVDLDPRTDVERDEGRLVVALDDGRTLEAYVAHARGSLERPLTDRELLEKVEALVEPVLPGAAAANEIDAAVRGLYEAADLRALVQAVTPRRVLA